MIRFFILFLFLLGAAWAEPREKELAGFDAKTDIIAHNYEAGAYLIYDCVEDHWTCVTQDYFEDCERKRSEDLIANKVEGRCAPIAELPTKKSCFQRQLFMVSQNFGNRACILPSWKDKEMLTR